jgi:hypothetical protein
MGPSGGFRGILSMSTPVVPPEGGGRPARQRRAGAQILAVIAAVSIVALIDSEIFAYGIPGIRAGSDLLHLPTVASNIAIGALALLTLWLSFLLARRVWRVERALDAAGETPTGC